MWILPLVGYVGVVVGFSFLTLSIGTLQIVQAELPLVDKCSSSFWPLLPLRTCRRAHSFYKETSHSPHLRSHSPTNPPLRSRQVSAEAIGSHDLQPCRVHAEPASVSGSQAHRSYIYCLMWYVAIAPKSTAIAAEANVDMQSSSS